MQLNASLFVDPTSTDITPTITGITPMITGTELVATNKPEDTATTSGVLGIYRITLWIIVLTLTIFSTAMTSLTSGCFL